jgi:hypothetical protein
MRAEEPMNETILATFDESLKRCNAVPDFLDRFYDRFVASSPKVAEKFAHTNFVRQKRALRASLHLLLIAAEDEVAGPRPIPSRPRREPRPRSPRHHRRALRSLARQPDRDGQASAIRNFDSEVENAWERVMMVGIHYMISKRDNPPKLTIID